MDLSSYRARRPDLIKGACVGAAVAMLVGFRARAGADLRRQVPTFRRRRC
jgi:hypothetical protein